MRIAVVMVALVACKAKERESAAPITVERGVAFDPGSAAIATPAMPAPVALSSRYPDMPSCERYEQLMTSLQGCAKVPEAAKDALRDAYTTMQKSWAYSMTSESAKAMDSGCKAGGDAIVQVFESLGCPVPAGMTAEAVPSSGSRDVPSEKGVPLDRAVLGALPRPFGALQPIKPTSTRDEILALVPDARRDGEHVKVPLGVDDLVATIEFDATDHISDIEIPIKPFPQELFEQAWGSAPDNIWIDRAAKWRADVSDDLHICPYQNLADVIGPGPDLLAEKTPLVGQRLATLEQQLGARLDEWTEQTDDGTDVTRPRLLLSATEVCHYDTMYLLTVEGGVVTGATLTQCYDGPAQRRSALAAMEKRWGRAQPVRTADDHLAFRFARPGRIVEMVEDEDESAWVVTIKR